MDELLPVVYDKCAAKVVKLLNSISFDLADELRNEFDTSIHISLVGPGIHVYREAFRLKSVDGVSAVIADSIKTKENKNEQTQS